MKDLPELLKEAMSIAFFVMLTKLSATSTLFDKRKREIQFYYMEDIRRECVRAGAAGSRTRRSSGHHVLNPQNFE